MRLEGDDGNGVAWSKGFMRTKKSLLGHMYKIAGGIARQRRLEVWIVSTKGQSMHATSLAQVLRGTEPTIK